MLISSSLQQSWAQEPTECYDHFDSFQNIDCVGNLSNTNNRIFTVNTFNLTDLDASQKETLRTVSYIAGIPLATWLFYTVTVQALNRIGRYLLFYRLFYSSNTTQRKKDHAFILFDIQKESSNPFIDDIKRVAVMDALDVETLKDYEIKNKDIILRKSESSDGCSSDGCSSEEERSESSSETSKSSKSSESSYHPSSSDSSSSSDNDSAYITESETDSEKNDIVSDSDSDSDESVYVHKKYIHDDAYTDLYRFVEERFQSNTHTFLLTYEKDGHDAQSFKMLLQDLFEKIPREAYTFVDIRQVFMATTGKTSSIHKNKFKKLYHCLHPLRVVTVYRKHLLKLLTQFNMSSTDSLIACLDKLFDDYYIFDMLHFIFKR